MDQNNEKQSIHFFSFLFGIDSNELQMKMLHQQPIMRQIKVKQVQVDQQVKHPIVG